MKLGKASTLRVLTFWFCTFTISFLWSDLSKPTTMLLPRPARLLRQCPSLLYRSSPPASVGQTRKYAATATARRVVPGSAEVEIDESYRHLLDDMRMQGSYKDRAGAGLRSEQSMRYRSEPGYTAAPDLLGEDDEYAAEWEPREERRSPAAVLGSKRIGLVVLPEQLVDGIQAEISGMFVLQHSSTPLPVEASNGMER